MMVSPPDTTVKLLCTYHKVELIYDSSVNDGKLITDAYCNIDHCPVKVHMEIE